MANVEDTVNKEYIDKHEAYLLLKQKAKTYMFPATKEAYEKAAILIDSLPTIEAQPVKHGKWEMNSDYPDRLICNQCNSTYDVYFSERGSMHYCSNCGCYMRDGGDSE